MRVRINGVRLNVEITGHGAPLLLLHGFLGSIETWRQFIPALARRHTVIALDLLGHGGSESPADPARYTAAYLVADVGALLDEIGVERCDVLGYSMGGRAALQAARGLPGRVGRLVLESTSRGIVDAGERERRRESDERLARMIEEEGVERFVEHWECVPLFATQRSLPDGAKRTLRTQRLRNNPAGLAGSLRGFGAGAVLPIVEPLPGERPALLVAGARDDKYVKAARKLVPLLPGSRVVVVPEAGHAVHLEQPGRFLHAVLGFLNETDRSEERRDTRMEEAERLHRHQVRVR